MSTARKRTNPVWEHFHTTIEAKEKGKNIMKALCMLCGVQLVHRGDTTSLASHLLAEHLEEYKHAFVGPSPSANQAMLTKIIRKCSPEHAATITKLIAEFVARDLRPLNVVSAASDNPEYHQARYQVSAHTHITKIYHQIFQTTKEELRTTLKGQPHVALTTDICTYTGIPNHHSALHYSRVEDGKCSVANMRDA